jgi:hypothetical protein
LNRPNSLFSGENQKKAIQNFSNEREPGLLRGMEFIFQARLPFTAKTEAVRDAEPRFGKASALAVAALAV